jgi:hypothetical protein
VGVPISVAFTLSLLKQLIIYVTSLVGGALWWRRKAGAGEAHAKPEHAATPFQS